MMSNEELVRQLIGNITKEVAPRSVLLENRIATCLAYIESTTNAGTPFARHVVRHLTGEYDDFKFDNPAATLRDLFERRWVCTVVSSGYHNGAGCAPGEPHSGWGCGYRWVAPALTDAEAGEMGITADGEAS